jgi:hypothetical protein
MACFPLRHYDMMRAIMLSLIVVSACASAAPPAPTSTPAAVAESRFRNVSELVLAEIDETREVGVHAALRYPQRQRQLRIEAGFAAIFIVDTSGAVELPSVTFAHRVPLDFMQSVCIHLRQQRFAQVMRDGVPRRAMGVRDFVFALQGGRWFGRRYDIAPIRQAILEKGIPASIPQLEGEAHCP